MLHYVALIRNIFYNKTLFSFFYHLFLGYVIYGCSKIARSNANENGKTALRDDTTRKIHNQTHEETDNRFDLKTKHGYTEDIQKALGKGISLESIMHRLHEYKTIIVNLETKNKEGETLFHFLANRGDVNFARGILDEIYKVASLVNVNPKKDIENILRIENSFTYSPLDISAINGHEAFVKFLSDYVNIKQLKSTKDLLSLYAQDPNPSMIKLLEDIIYNKDKDHLPQEIYTPLDLNDLYVDILSPSTQNGITSDDIFGPQNSTPNQNDQ